MKEGECDNFACARRPLGRTGFLLYNIAVYVYCYLDSIRCSWITKMIIALAFVGYEMIIVNSVLHASFAIHRLISNLHSWNNYLQAS